MNVDLNELSMNLVPFPRLHYLIAAQSPITSYKTIAAPRKWVIICILIHTIEALTRYSRMHTQVTISLYPQIRKSIRSLQHLYSCVVPRMPPIFAETLIDYNRDSDSFHGIVKPGKSGIAKFHRLVKRQVFLPCQTTLQSLLHSLKYWNALINLLRRR